MKQGFRPKFLMAALMLLALSASYPTGSWAEESAGQAAKIHAALAQNGGLTGGIDVKRDELNQLYQLRDYQPAWNTDPKADRAALNGFLDSVQAYITYHGLAERDYPVDLLRKLIASKDEADSIRLEVLMTAWLLRLAHDMQGDRINLAQIYPGWSLSREKINIPIELAAAIRDNRVQKFFDDLAPDDLSYLRLADALKAYRTIEREKGNWPTVGTGPTIKPQMNDPRVAQVRARLQAEGYTLPLSPSDPDAYTDDLKDVVIAYQSRNGLEADGNIGAKTVQAMNVPVSKRIGQILANMERMRHMPDHFPSRYARVNIADASIRVVEDGKTLYHAVVVLGRPDRKTPFIHSAIRSVIFNPSWTVPSKIAREDILPKLRKDPHYLEKMGMVINGSADDPYGKTIDWHTIQKSEFNFRLRQSPGDLNSLGQIKFDFDNDFSVYLHDTSHPELFAKAERHLSSGCVRIRDPEQFAEIILAHNSGNWDQAAVQAEIAKGKTHWMKVTEPLPLYILYDTAFFPTADSLIHFRADVYNYDEFLLNMMKNGGRTSQAE